MADLKQKGVEEDSSEEEEELQPDPVISFVLAPFEQMHVRSIPEDSNHCCLWICTVGAVNANILCGTLVVAARLMPTTDLSHSWVLLHGT